MTEYDVEAVADELGLTAADLREAFELYFEDAFEIIRACGAALEIPDYDAAAKAMHALKGLSNNYRIRDIGAAALGLETLAKTGRGAEMARYLPGIQGELATIREQIRSFYAKPSESSGS
ncbi:MAG: Hpt domain-containing protein [Negativicutes bacterium]|nr:Hpt domain-containing protein [Negativicutes bacterium]